MLWKLQHRVPVNELGCWKLQRPANKAAKPGIRLHKRLTPNANWKGLKPGSLQHMSTGFRHIKQKKKTKHPDSHSSHALQCRYMYAGFCLSGFCTQKCENGRDSLTAGGNSFFHSSNSYINLCGHLELVRLTQFLCWHFRTPANEKLGLAGLSA